MILPGRESGGGGGVCVCRVGVGVGGRLVGEGGCYFVCGFVCTV